MTDQFKIGIVTGLLLYSFGGVCTVAVYQFSGWEYHHAPPAAFIPFMITLATGVVRVLMCFFKLLVNKSSKAKGELSIHACVGLILVVIIFSLR